MIQLLNRPGLEISDTPANMQLSNSGEADDVFMELLKFSTVHIREEGNVAATDLNADIYWIIYFQNAFYAIVYRHKFITTL